MSRVSLLNREPNFKSDICQRISKKGIICDNISKNNIDKISTPFEEVRKEDKSISSIDDLKIATQRVKDRELARKRVLEKKENGGYVLIGSLTCMGTLAIATLIFITIKFIVMG